jgi:hypothetical protein
LAVAEIFTSLADERIESPVHGRMNEEKIQFMSVMHPSGLKPWLKRSAFLRFLVRKMKPIYGEVRFTAHAVRSGRLFVFQRNYALSRRLQIQKVITYTVDLPPLRDFHALIAWLDENSMRYQEGAFCIYIPPQERTQRLFGSVLSAYPPHSGLKILKELKAPTEAKYCSRDVHPSATRAAVRVNYRPLDYLRVANYMYDKGVGPRVYDLIEIQTPHNSLSAYVVQHVAGTIPSMDECRAFLQRLDHLYEDQLVPLLPGWKAAKDFRCPDCQGNLIRDEVTGKALHVDFQTFMVKDARQYILQIADEIREDVHFGSAHWIRGGKYLHQSIPGLCIGKRDVNPRWNLFKQALQRQEVSVEGSVVFDIGCNAGMIMYLALTDGAAWAVGWGRPAVAAAARKLLLSLGMTRFDILGQNISSDTDFPSTLPLNVKLSKNSILFFLAIRKYVGFPDSVKDLPFKYMVYEDDEGESLSDVKNYLKEIVDGWGLRIVDVTSYIDGDSKRERVIAVLHRD